MTDIYTPERHRLVSVKCATTFLGVLQALIPVVYKYTSLDFS